MKGTTAIFVIAAFVSTIFLAGCIHLKADSKSQLLPTRGYGTFKMKIDDPGPVAEVDEGGVLTGRHGFLYDIDQSGKPNLFFQIKNPSAGIVTLAFDPVTLMAVGGQAAAIVRPVPGKTHYEVPLQSLTQWIKGDQAIGYRKSEYVDQPDILVWNDRIFNREAEAPMTGQTATHAYQIVSLGVLDASGGGRVDSSENKTDSVDEQGSDLPALPPPDGDIEPESVGGLNLNCTKWIPICTKLQQCNHFGTNWSTVDCTNTLFAYTKSSSGQTYDTCVGACNPGASCTEFMNCRATCANKAFVDFYGGGGDYGPEANDVVMLVERGGQMFKVSPGYTVEPGEKLTVAIDYKSVAANFGGGSVNVTVGSKTVVFPAPAHLGHSSFADKVMLGLTIQSPLPKGTYQLAVRMQNAAPCATQGKPFPIRFASAGVTTGDNTPTQGNVPFEMYEVYSTGIDKFNVGQGFIDESVFRTSSYPFFQQLATFGAGIIQGEIWSMTGVDTWGWMTIDDINKDVFTNTHDTHGDKYNQANDTQAASFYCDQPVPPGAFSFYGDAGWNIYPIGPYGQANTKQSFIRGDFEHTVLHIPFTPIEEVSPKYTGCADTCDYWVNYIYSPAVGRTAPGFPTQAAALTHCHANSADPYWLGLIGCFRLAEGAYNACVSLDDCLKGLPTPHNSGQTLCGNAAAIPGAFKVTIPPEFLASPKYGPMLRTPGQIKVGVAGQTSSGWELIPGSFADLDLNVENYPLSLPYMPEVPIRFLPAQAPEGITQAQMFAVLYDSVGKQVVGTGYYEPAAQNPTSEWNYLYIYAYQWADPGQEGWSLGIVAGNSITDFANPYNSTVGITFGDLRAIQGGKLTP